MTRKLLHTYLLFATSFFCIIASAQQDTIIHQKPVAQDTIITDTVTKEVLIPLRQRVADEIKKNIDQLNRDKIAARQNKVLDDILEISQKANDYLESGIDTAGIASQLDYILRLYDVAGDGIFTNKGTTQTERNLATTSSLLRELLNRAEISKHSLESYLKSLVGFQNNINITNHADNQYLIMKFRKRKVRMTAEMLHSTTLKMKGGSRNINWKTHKTICIDDKIG